MDESKPAQKVKVVRELTPEDVGKNERELVQHHGGTNNSFVHMRVGEHLPCLVIHASGARLKTRLEEHFRSIVSHTPFLYCPIETVSGTNVTIDTNNTKLVTFAEVQALQAQHPTLASDSSFSSVTTKHMSLFSLSLLDTPSMDAISLIRMTPVLDGAALTQFASVKEDITKFASEKNVSEVRRVKMESCQPYLSLSPVYEQLANQALEYLLGYVHNISILSRYIASLYSFIYKCEDIKQLVNNPILWEQLQNTPTRITAYPKSISKEITDTIFAKEDLEVGSKIILDPKAFTQTLYVLSLHNRLGYVLMNRGAWSCPPPFQRQTVNTETTPKDTQDNGSVALAVPNDMQWNTTAACKTRISRAYYKLEEVFEYLNTNQHLFKPTVDTRNAENAQNKASQWGWWMPRKDCEASAYTPSAIDIGACPGGWTYSLAMRGAKVLSIDPGVLSITHANITHVPHLLQDRECVETMTARGPVDMVVCDINCDMAMTTDIVIKHVLEHSLMKPGSIVVLTVKSFASNTLGKMIKNAYEELDVYFDCLQTVWLLANRKERTIIGVRKNL